MDKITIHDYDGIIATVWDDRELDDGLDGTLKLEIVETDEVYLSLKYEERLVTFYTSLSLLEALLNKAKLSEPSFLISNQKVTE
jgi:hypothetical protein